MFAIPLRTCTYIAKLGYGTLSRASGDLGAPQYCRAALPSSLPGWACALRAKAGLARTLQDYRFYHRLCFSFSISFYLSYRPKGQRWGRSDLHIKVDTHVTRNLNLQTRVIASSLCLVEDGTGLYSCHQIPKMFCPCFGHLESQRTMARKLEQLRKLADEPHNSACGTGSLHVGSWTGSTNGN